MDIEEMRRIKDQRGYSIRQIAEYSGVPEGTVRKIFTGETAHPRVATMIALERVLTGDEQLYKGKNYAYDMKSVLPKYEAFLDEAGSGGSSVEETVFAYGKKDLMTVEDYEALPEDCRCELIDGVLYDMGAPSFTHQDLAAEVLNQIRNHIKAKGLKCKAVAGPVDVHITQDDYNMVQPDVVIVCREKTRITRRIEGAPSFCLEVVSKWSFRQDYVLKLNKYSQAGVEEYWVLDPFKRRLFRYCSSTEYVPEIFPLEGTCSLKVFGDELKIDLDALAAIIDEGDE